MTIPRALYQPILDKLTTYTKAIILYGSRQVGKTTLVNQLLDALDIKSLRINGDQSTYVEVLSSRDLPKLQALVAGYDLLFVDEAQRIPEIGINLKILTDSLPKLKIIITGSSSLDLASKVKEPLTGRAWSYKLFPVAFSELKAYHNTFELEQQLEERLIYGAYPEIFSFNSPTDKKEYLQNLSDAYLYKDILELADIKNSRKIRDLLRLLAFQVGSEVSLTELGSGLNLSRDTVARYLDLLEQSFVIVRLSGLSRNLRKEVTKMDKIYFCDLGVRNMMIDNFKPLSNRDDTGPLWENFIIIERLKLLTYTKTVSSSYFWRTYTGAELDYVEERDGTLFGYEAKFNETLPKTPASWLATYPEAQYQVVNRSTYLDFLLKL